MAARHRRTTLSQIHDGYSERVAVSAYRRLENYATVLGTAALLGLTVLVLGHAFGFLLDAWDYYQRRADAQLMWFAYALSFVAFVYYGAIVGSLTAASAKVSRHRPALLLVTGILTSGVGVWAIAEDFSGAFGIAGAASVIAGLCALIASIVLFGLRLRVGAG